MERLERSHQWNGPGAGSFAVAHIRDCSECTAQYETIRRVLALVTEAPVPERGDDYGDQIWTRLRWKLGSERRRRATWASSIAAAAALAMAFFAGHFWRTRHETAPQIANTTATTQVRQTAETDTADRGERVLLLVVGDHLDRTERMLLEIANADPKKGLQIGQESRRAGELVAANRIYRQTALQRWNERIASILGMLEPVLIEISHSGTKLGSDELAVLQKRIEAKGLLFKVRAERTDRERERKEARVERESDMYDEGTDALDKKDWARAASIFRSVARMQLEHADASLYWLARAQNELGQRAEALATLLELKKAFPKSHWAEDGKALDVEIRQSSGQKVEPDQLGDDDVKLIVLNGLMGSDPDKALPVLDKVIIGSSSARVKERAIFVLSQSNTPRAMEVLGRIARDSARPDLQLQALRYLGIMGGENSRKVLADVYGGTRDIKIKKNILKSYMISGDRVRLFALAKSESDAELRGDAVKQLGIIGARGELADLYNSETSAEIKKNIIQAMFIGGSSDRLGEIAKNEKNPELRAAAIKNLGLMGNARTGELLVSIYETDPNTEVRESVIKSLFLQSNGKALIALARKEKNPTLKREIISKLSLIRSDEVSEYLLEVLKD